MGFCRIADVIAATLERDEWSGAETLEAVLEADACARNFAREEICKRGLA